MTNNDASQAIVDIGIALSNPTRLFILGLVDRGSYDSAGEVVEAVRGWRGDISQPSVSRHLSFLRGAGLVCGDRHGQQRSVAITELGSRVLYDLRASVNGSSEDSHE